MILSNVNDDDHVKSGSLWISGILFLSNVNGDGGQVLRLTCSCTCKWVGEPDFGDGGLAVSVVGSSRYSGFNWERIKSRQFMGGSESDLNLDMDLSKQVNCD